MKKKLLSFCAVLAAGLGVYAVSTLAEVQAETPATYDVDYAYLTNGIYANGASAEKIWEGAKEFGFVDANNIHRISRYEVAPLTGEIMSTEINVPNGTYDVEVYAAANLAHHEGDYTVDKNLDGSTECTVLVVNGIEKGVPFLYDGIYIPASGMTLFKFEGVNVTDGKISFAINNKVAAANWISVAVKSIKPTVALTEAELFKNGADLTWMLKNPDFTTGLDGWTTSDFVRQANEGMYGAYTEHWEENPKNAVGKSIYQDVKLPAGKYEFSAILVGRNLETVLSAKVGEEVLDTAQCSNIVKEARTLTFSLDTAATVRFQYESNAVTPDTPDGWDGWIAIDNCSLKCIEVAGAVEPVDPPVVVDPVYIEGKNFDFALGDTVKVGICTYDYDVEKNGADGSGLQEVVGWTTVENGNGKSAGIYKYGTSAWLGGNKPANVVPAQNPQGAAEGTALGLLACWGGNVQYTQELELPAGTYILSFAIYNTAGTQAIGENYFGFIEENDTKHFATSTTYAEGQWSNEIVKLSVTEDTKGKLSVGYKSSGAGGDSNPHLFVDCVKIEAVPMADVKALKAAIEETEETYYLGFFEGECAPYNNIEQIKTLAEAKELAALAVSEEQNQVDSITKALKEAKWVVNTEEMNAVYNGDFHIGENGAAVPYWSNVNKGGYGNSRLFKYGPLTAETSAADSANYKALGAMQPNDTVRAALYVRYNENPGAWYNYGTATGYTMPLEAYHTYRFECDLAQWGEGDGDNNIQILDEDGTVVGGKTNIHAEHIDANNIEEGAKGEATHVVFSFVPKKSGNHRLCFWSPGGKKHFNVISNISIKTMPGTEAVIGSYSLYKAEFEERNWLSKDDQWHPVVWEKNSAVEVSPYENENEVVISGFVPGNENIMVLGTVDMLEGTITIEPQIVSGDEDGDQMYLFCKDSIDADGNYVVRQPVVATIDENFNINLDGWNLFSAGVPNPEGGVEPLADADDDVDPGMGVGDTEFVYTPYFRNAKVFLKKGAPTLEAQEIVWTQEFSDIKVDEAIALIAKATSGLEVVYEMDASEIAKLEGATLTFSAAGTVKVTAKQEGNAYWKAAEPVVKEITLVIEEEEDPGDEPTDGITSISADDANALFFDLKGRQVRNPQQGTLYIVVKGNKAYKAIVK